MTEHPELDITAAHRFFSVECFNRAWDLIDKNLRTPEEDDQMLQLGMVSLWHWQQRPDCSQQSLSVGCWQVSRIFSLLKQAGNARRYGLLCLEASQAQEVSPFYLGYAYEALARAEMVAGDTAKKEEYLKKARETADRIEDPEEKKLLLADLETI
jgi:hypothetical protein